MAKIVCPRCGEACASEDSARRHCTPWRIARRTGYRLDSKRHAAARFKLSRKRRREIGRAGAAVTNARKR